MDKELQERLLETIKKELVQYFEVTGSSAFTEEGKIRVCLKWKGYEDYVIQTNREAKIDKMVEMLGKEGVTRAFVSKFEGGSLDTVFEDVKKEYELRKEVKP